MYIPNVNSIHHHVMISFVILTASKKTERNATARILAMPHAPPSMLKSLTVNSDVPINVPFLPIIVPPTIWDCRRLTPMSNKPMRCVPTVSIISIPSIKLAIYRAGLIAKMMPAAIRPSFRSVKLRKIQTHPVLTTSIIRQVQTCKVSLPIKQTV